MHYIYNHSVSSDIKGKNSRFIRLYLSLLNLLFFGETVLALRLETAHLVGCLYAIYESTCWKWCMDFETTSLRLAVCRLPRIDSIRVQKMLMHYLSRLKNFNSRNHQQLHQWRLRQFLNTHSAAFTVVCGPKYVPLVTACHRQQHLQWDHEHQN